MPSVRIARLSTDVKAMSKTYPPSFRRRPASAASARPRSDRSTSVQPVKRFSLFQVLSPWRSRTTLCTYCPPSREARRRAQFVFDPDDRVLTDPVLVETDHFLRRPVRLARLLERVPAAARPQLTRRDVERDPDVVTGLQPRFTYRFKHDLDRFTVRFEIRSEPP